MRLLLLLMLAPAAALAEPESLTIDCLASARASYSVVCSDPAVRELAGEERRLFEHHRTSGLTTPARLLSLQLGESDGLFARDYCIKDADPADCMAASLAQQIIEHWGHDALPPLETGLTAPPIEMSCQGQSNPVYALLLPRNPPVMAVSIDRRAALLMRRPQDVDPTYEKDGRTMAFLSPYRAALTIDGATVRCIIR